MIDPILFNMGAAKLKFEVIYSSYIKSITVVGLTSFVREKQVTRRQMLIISLILRTLNNYFK